MVPDGEAVTEPLLLATLLWQEGQWLCGPWAGPCPLLLRTGP